MQWNQIKTLLIVSFLVLDIYLFVQFMEKKEAADIGVLEQPTTSIEEQLKDDRITYSPLPDKEYEETFISVEQYEFNEREIKKTDFQIDQEITIVKDHFIVSKLEDRVTLNESARKKQIEQVFSQLVHHADEYAYWNWNKEENIIIFFQEKFDRSVYYNQNGVVLLFLNDQNEIDFYIQSMLGEAESLAEKQELMKPMQAIETLYRANELSYDSHINNVNIGFHTRVPFETDVQVFAPIWKVQVNDEKDYFVNAIEGFIFSTDEKEFLDEVIELVIRQIKSQKIQTDQLKKIVTKLEKRVKD